MKDLLILFTMSYFCPLTLIVIGLFLKLFGKKLLSGRWKLLTSNPMDLSQPTLKSFAAKSLIFGMILLIIVWIDHLLPLEPMILNCLNATLGIVVLPLPFIMTEREQKNKNLL